MSGEQQVAADEQAPESGSSATRRSLLIALGAVAGALAFYLGMVLGSSSDIPAPKRSVRPQRPPIVRDATSRT